MVRNKEETFSKTNTHPLNKSIVYPAIDKLQSEIYTSTIKMLNTINFSIPFQTFFDTVFGSI